MRFDTEVQLRVIVVGSSTDGFVQYTMSLLEECEIDFVVCDDVYFAAGELAKSINPNFMVVGRLGQLSREKGRLMQMAIDKGFWCCCLADGSWVQTQSYFRTGLKPRKAAVFLINEADQLKQVISTLLEEDYTSLKCRKENEVQEFIKDEFVTTQAELDALLGS